MKIPMLLALAFVLSVINIDPARAGGCFEDPIYEHNWSATVTTGARVRSVACMEGSEVLTTLAVGTKVAVTGETDGWYRVRTDGGTEGWVGTWLLSVSKEPANLIPVPVPVAAANPTLVEHVKGRILLQVDQRGEAWYVNPVDTRRYYMTDGPAAYQMMRSFGLGITDSDLHKIPSVATTAEMLSAKSVCSVHPLAKQQKGRILLQVQQHGEAWYVDPDKCYRIYMKDGGEAYSIMRYLSLGIGDTDLGKIPEGTIRVK